MAGGWALSGALQAQPVPARRWRAHSRLGTSRSADKQPGGRCCRGASGGSPSGSSRRPAAQVDPAGTPTSPRRGGQCAGHPGPAPAPGGYRGRAGGEGPGDSSCRSCRGPAPSPPLAWVPLRSPGGGRGRRSSGPLFQRPRGRRGAPGPATAPHKGGRRGAGAGTGSPRAAPPERGQRAPSPGPPRRRQVQRPRPRRCRERRAPRPSIDRSPAPIDHRLIAAPASPARRPAPTGRLRASCSRLPGAARPRGPFAFLRPRAAAAAARPLPFPPGPAWSSPGLWAARHPKPPWGRPGRWLPSLTPHSRQRPLRNLGILSKYQNLVLAFLHGHPELPKGLVS